MNTIGAYCPGYSQASSAEANAYSFSVSTAIYFLSPCLKLPPNPVIFIDGFPQACPWISWDVGFRLMVALPLLPIFFSVSTTTFLTTKRLWFTWLLVSFGGLGGAWTPSDIKNYLTSGLKLLKTMCWYLSETLHLVGVHHFWGEIVYETHLLGD